MNERINKNIAEDLIRLRDELVIRAFSENGAAKDSTLAEVVFKINSCLYKGYPRRVEKSDHRDKLIKSVDIIGDR